MCLQDITLMAALVSTDVLDADLSDAVELIIGELCRMCKGLS